MAKHRGVRFVEIVKGSGRLAARWVDPVSRKVQQVDCKHLGLTNEKQRELWAVGKHKALQALRASVARDGAIGNVPIAKSIEDYIAGYANKNTTSNKKPPLDAFATFLKDKGARNVQDITEAMLADWGEHLRRPANPHAPRTRNHYLVTSAAWMNWARRKKTLPRVTREHISDALQRAKPPKDPIRVLQPAELRAVLESCIEHDRHERFQVAPVALLVVATGMRAEEAFGLLWGEVDLAGNVIRLPASRTKTATARKIALAESPSAADLLGALRLRSGGKARVFPWVDRRTAQMAREATIADYSAPRWTWRELRATCGSLLVNAGAIYGGSGPFRAKERLGHSLEIAEKHYLGSLSGVPAGAATVEQAAGIVELAAAIVRSVGVVQQRPAVAAVAT